MKPRSSMRSLVLSGLAAAAFGCATGADDGSEPVDQGTPKVDTSSSADVNEALRALPDSEVLGRTDDGVVTAISGDLAKVGYMHAEDREAADAMLRPVLGGVIAPFRLTPDDVELTRITTDENGYRHARYRQVRDGLEVVGGDLIVHVDVKGTITSVNGTARGDLPNFNGKSQISAAAAIAKVQGDARYLSMAPAADARQVYVILPDGAMHKAWETTFEGVRGVDPQKDKVYVSVDTGSIVAIHPKYHYALNRLVYSANNGSSLPGTLRRSEGQAATTDVDVNAAYDNSGATYTAYNQFWNRDSYDNNGAALRSTVHYSVNYCNAFWNGTQMVYGDGSGSSCRPLARSVDVAAHELTHAVTEYESNLTYSGESGGINEAMSDIFGAFVEAWVDGGMDGDLAISGDTWLVGEDILPPYLRKMDDPAADGNSLDFWTSGAGNVDVHYSSGIANLAFYLLSQGGTHPRGKSTVQVTGIGMDKAIRIFYKANTDLLTSSSNYAALRTACLTAAQQLGYDAATQTQVGNAFAAVGVGGGTPPTGEDIPLTNGVTKTGLSGASQSLTYYKLDVPAGQTTLVFTLAGGTGDADMYVRRGSRPTTSTYDCRPYLNGNNETCTINSPVAATYFVMLRGYTAYSGTSLRGTYSATPTGDPYLTSGVPVTGISGAQGNLKYWRIAVPAGRPSLTVTIRPGTGSTGDADLYVRSGSRPTTTSYNCRPYLSGNNETCTISNPAAGDWYIMLRGYSAYSNVTLTGTH
jgi:vibriolysin